MSIFSKLKIHGYPQAQESAVFAALFLGEPLLFMGPKGVAKTEVVASIGMALREASKRKHPNDPSKWFSYQIYDASKLNFEDLVGYPNPHAMKLDPPKVDYIPTNSTIWNKHMVAFDELNRCAEDRQSNLFEIIRSRKLHGIPTNNHFIYSTINPFGDVGTLQMSDALVDRHLFYLHVPHFSSMNFEDRQKVINRVGSFDGVGLRYWAGMASEFDTVEQNQSADIINNKLADIGDDIEKLMALSAEQYKELDQDLKDQVATIINYVVSSLSQTFEKEKEAVKREIELSGRRASAMLRGILAIRAVDLAMNTMGIQKKFTNMVDCMINAIKLTIPIGISGNLNKDLLTKVDKLIEEKVKSLWDKYAKTKNEVDKDQYSYLTSCRSVVPVLESIFSADSNDLTRTKVLSSLMKTKYNDNVPSGRAVSMALYRLSIDFPHIFKDVPVKAYDEQSMKGQAVAADIEMFHLSKYAGILDGHITSLQKKYPVIAFVVSSAVAHEVFDHKDKTDQDALEFVMSLTTLIETLQLAYDNIAQTSTK